MNDFEAFPIEGMNHTEWVDEQEIMDPAEDAMLFGVATSVVLDRTEPEPTLHLPLSQVMENGDNTPHSLAGLFDMTNDDDDEVIMMDLQDTSQHHLTEHINGTSLERTNTSIFATQEPKEDTPITANPPTIMDLDNSHQLLEAQKMMLDRLAAHGNHDVGLGNSHALHADQAEEVYDTGGHLADNATQATHDDNSWMNAEPEEDEEYRSLTESQNMLQVRKNNGKITVNEAYELYRIEHRLRNLNRLKAASKDGNASEHFEEEESLFVEDNIGDQAMKHYIGGEVTASTTIDRTTNITGVDDFEGFSRMLSDVLDENSNKSRGKKPRKPRKKAEKRPKDAREFRARENARLQADRTNARHRKESKRSLGAQSKAKGKGKSRKDEVLGTSESLLRPAHFNPENGEDHIGTWIIDNLVSNNPIEDRLKNPIFNAEPEPEITGGLINKATQFQKLVANIPDGGSSRIARNDKKKLKLASQSFGYAKVRAVNGKWLVKGMRSTLYHHQLLGAQWMASRELSEEAPNGGLLADSMGLGKTIQTIACMVGNPPSPEDLKRKVRATLIIVPAAVMDQWIDEFKVHAEEGIFLKIHKYKASGSISAPILQDCDVVITSYSEVMKEYPFPDKDQRASIQRMGYKEWLKEANPEVGVLHQITWYRVVLDEAHAIKNNCSRTSLACQNLKSVYRWCLTGTPILNRVEELFPYLRFLRANYSIDMQMFQKYFCDPDTAECQNRLSAVLSYTMMRRTMATTIMGRPIVTLPLPHPKIEYIDFSQEEKIIYRITENRFRQTLNMFIAKGDIRRKYGVFMVQLLRLRQCTSHPFMLERTIKELWTLDDVKELKERLEQLNSSPAHLPFYEQTRVWVRESDASQTGSVVDQDIAEELLPFGRGAFGTDFNMDKAIGMLSENDICAKISCGLCQDMPQEPMTTNCGHVFCEDCLGSDMHSKAAEQNDIDCPSCGLIITDTYKSGRSDTTGDDELSSSESGSQPRRSQIKKRGQPKVPENSKGRDALGFEPYTAYSSWIMQSDTDAEFPLVPSAKTAALKSVLLKGFAEAPLDKVVIYVQFRTLARIVGRMCKQEGWGYLYLSGDCPLDHRNKVLKMFRDDPDISILIAGLKCGGVGLNFPWANRCISLDLWWNHGVEQQAFGRIFRIGQDKETYMTRIVVKNSVDMRLLTMQAHKLRDVDRTITETDTKPGLSLNQLANLFGFLRTDADGQIVSIEADYQDDNTVPSATGSTGE